MDQTIYNKYVQILREELMVALGCTEPIAVAYASAVARKTLGCSPDGITVRCSGNIIKNVKDVTVPNSGGQIGIEAAAILGVLGGNADKALEVLTDITEEQIERSKELKAEGFCRVELAEGVANLYVSVTVSAGNDTAKVVIEDKHTNIVKIEKNGEILLEKEQGKSDYTDRSFMTVTGIMDFAKGLHIEDVKDLFDQQILCNTTISEEGMNNHYGAGVGQRMVRAFGDTLQVRAAAKAAAGSDARMNGCDLGVVINSGSGNQGITVTVPIVEYAKSLNVSDEVLYKALAVSNLIAVHLKHGIGSLSAFCGAISASAGVSAAVTYMRGGNRYQVCKAISDTLAILAGVICDGAKASCAGKIAMGLTCGFLASDMALAEDDFSYGNGILGREIESTIKNVARLGRDGMKQTDVEILNIMIGN